MLAVPCYLRSACPTPDLEMRMEREDRIINGKTNLTVAAIFLMDDNWKIFRQYGEIIG